MKRFTLHAAFVVASILGMAVLPALADDIGITLIPDYDIVGDQIEVVQGYYGLSDSPDQMWISWGIYDTGASVVTLSATDQLVYEILSQPVPTKPGVESVAEGVGGNVIGDVSQPGYVVSDGLHIFDFDFANLGDSENLYNWNLPGGDPTKPKSAVATNVQMFVGTPEGSQYLPTISGTPVHNSINHSGAAAAYINKQGYAFELSELFPEYFDAPYTYYVPDLQYVDAGTKLASAANTTGVIRIPLTLLGADNQSNPGDEVTIAPNPFVTTTRLDMDLDPATAPVTGKNFLFDTGAMMSLISTDVANQLGIDLNNVAYTLDVAGASGNAMSVNGYVVPLLELAYDNLDGDSGYLQIRDVPFFVFDIGSGIDGILGMNLFNTATEMLYDPNDPDGASLQVAFSTEPRILEDDISDLIDTTEYALYKEILGEAFTSMFVHTGSYSVPEFAGVPEPSALIMLAIGASLLALRRLRRRAR